jgi:hypothetical protein
MKPAQKSLLDNLRIASPCSESWDKMSGDDRKRHCAACQFDVFNISSMTRDEAEAFLREHTGQKVCGRLYTRPDGTIITADCPVGSRRVKRKRMTLAAMATLILSTIGGSMALAAKSETTSRWDRSSGAIGQMLDSMSHKLGISSLCNCTQVIMGDMCVIDDPIMGEVEFVEPTPETQLVDEPIEIDVPPVP